MLLVDDEPSILQVIGYMIKSWGYEVITATCGKEAISIVVAKNADIVVLDYMMPELDGIDTLKEIRKIDTKIPAIMFSANPDGLPMKGTENLGISAFIPKLSTEFALRTAISAVEEKIQRTT